MAEFTQLVQKTREMIKLEKSKFYHFLGFLTLDAVLLIFTFYFIFQQGK
jgi:hypothetical protein